MLTSALIAFDKIKPLKNLFALEMKIQRVDGY